jgi:cyclopropane fatty-acyl-phospholipid synthase-like methyltransferase
VEVRLADYRDLAVQGLVFDKILSVGMFKYVGKDYIPTYFQCLQKMLKPHGLSLLHTITRSRESAAATWLEKYIFPQGYIPSLREIVWTLPEHSFHLIDAESLRLHYALTTRWAENFEKVTEKVREATANILYACGASTLWAAAILLSAAGLMCTNCSSAKEFATNSPGQGVMRRLVTSLRFGQ